jgi:hypothetical protein
MHQGIPVIEGWGNPSHIQSVMKKIVKNNRKAWEIGQVVN